MKKLTCKDVEKMRAADKEHALFSEKSEALTKRLSMAQIEFLFPDSLLILSEVEYKVDEIGNLVIENAVVDRFCDSAQEAAKYINENYCSVVEHGIPYHTGVTKYGRPVVFKKENKTSNFVSVERKDSNTYDKKVDTTLSFPELSADEEGIISIKSIDSAPLISMFRKHGLTDSKIESVMNLVSQEIDKVSARDFDLQVLTDCIESALKLMGYKISGDFTKLIYDLADKHYPRLINRDNVIVFHNRDDKEYLTEYCNEEEYKVSYIKSDRFNDLLSAILNDRCKKVVVESHTMESMPLVKTKILGLLAIRCEVTIEILSM